MPSSAAELAFYSARVALAGDAIHPAVPVRLRGRDQGSFAATIVALQQHAKPVRITGGVKESTLELCLDSVADDPLLRARFADRLRTVGDTPFLLRDASDSSAVLVIAFDHLLSVTKATWRQFVHEYWLDPSVKWSAGDPTSLFVQDLAVPQRATEGVVAVMVAGYQVGNSIRSPLFAEAWGLQ